MLDDGMGGLVEESRASEIGQALRDERHYWVIQAGYVLTDPDTALDDVVLDSDNFVGLSPIRCAICLRRYHPALRGRICIPPTGLFPDS